MTKKPKVLDLFSGCGGLSYGFIQAGYDVVAGVDHDAPSLETFKLNHPHSKALKVDLFEKSAIKNLTKELEGQEVDVIVGGPPCQGFSLTGPRNFDDKRNTLYLSFIKIVKELKPKAFIIENVPGLAVMYKGKVKDEIIKRFTKLGYNVEFKILTAADYGVPQMRRRVFFVGLKKELGTFEFPKPTHNKDTYITTSEAINDLPGREKEFGTEEDLYKKEPKTSYQAMMRKGSKKLLNHVASAHTELIKSIIAQVPDGGNYKHLPEGVGGNRKFNEAWTRYNSKKPSKTIDTGHRNHFHYKYNRIPTVRENARLQSFPDSFVFVGTRTNQNRQVGNAVPPLLAKAVASKLLKYLNNEKNRK